MNELKDKWSLVTGASSGMGVDFATILAEKGSCLILVARREERLRELQQKLQEQHGVRVEVVGMDLSVKDAPQVLYDRIKEMGHTVDILINNAGYGMYGVFVELPWERQRNMLELDIITLVHMTKLFIKDMVARNSGYILQISSIGAYQPSPTYATYAAAKSFVLNFGEALNYELRNTKVKVSVLSPGATATEFFQVSGQKPPLYARLTMMESRKVAEIGIKTMLKGRMSKVSGFPSSFMAWSTRFAPRRLTAAIANLLMEGDKK